MLKNLMLFFKLFKQSNIRYYFIVLLPFLISLIFRVYEINKVTLQGNLYKEIQSNVEKLKVENSALRIKIFKTESLLKIEQDIKELKLIKLPTKYLN